MFGGERGEISPTHLTGRGIESIDSDQRIKEREAAAEYKRVMDEARAEAEAKMREQRVVFPEADPKAAQESEGDYTRKFRDHIFKRGIHAMVEKP